MFNVTQEGDRTTVFSDKDGKVVSVKLPTEAYAVFTEIGSSPISNKELQYRLMESMSCTQGRACALIERFCAGYEGFNKKVALIVGIEQGRSRYFVSVSEESAKMANMINKRNSGVDSLVSSLNDEETDGLPDLESLLND